MPTIIDSLLVTLGLDSKSYEAGIGTVGKGLQELETEAKATQKALNEAIKNGAGADTLQKLSVKANQAAASLKNVQTAARGQAKETSSAAKTVGQFLAVIGGTLAIKNFITDTIESSAALGRLSDNLQTNVSTVSAWSNATELAGGSASGLQGTMDMLSRSQTELMLTGQSALIPYFSSLGVALADATGKARPLDDILLDLSDRFSKMDRTTANNMGRMMGIDQGTLQLLLKGRTEVEAMIKAQKEYGAVNKEQAEEAARAERAMKTITQTFSALGRELLHKAMPAIEMLLDGLVSIASWAKQNSTFVLTFITLLAAGLASLVTVTIPINATVIAIAALAAGIAALYQSYQTWKSGGDTLIDWGKWEPGITAASKAIRQLKDLLGDLVYRAIAATDAMAAIATGNWKRLKFAVSQLISGNGAVMRVAEEAVTGKPPEAETQPTGKPTTYSNPQIQQPQTAGQQPPAVSNEAPKNKGETEQYAVDYFRKLGWTLEQSAGIVANLKKESSFNNKAVGDNGQAYGIAQWHPDRQAEFQKQFGKSMKGSSLEEQMQFVHYELTQGKEQKAGEKLKQAKSEQQSAATISVHYERPAATAKEANERALMAKNIADRARANPSPPVVAVKPGEIAKAVQPAQPTRSPTSPQAQPVAVTPSVQNKQPAAPIPAVSEPVANKAAPPTPVPQVTRAPDQPASDNNLLTAIARAISTMMQFMVNQSDAKKPVGSTAAPAYQLPNPVYNGIPGAAAAAQGVGASQVAQAANPIPQQPANNTSTVETNIAKIEVHTAATDAQGMAKDLANSQNWQFIAQANYGMR